MPTLIKIEGDSPYLLPHVDHISAIAHGENVDLTMYVALPGHADLEQIYVQLSLPAADDLLAQLARAVAETAKPAASHHSRLAGIARPLTVEPPAVSRARAEREQGPLQ